MENEQEPTPEFESEIINECHECHEQMPLDDSNTIMFQGNNNQWYAYVQCDNECEPETIEISPQIIQFFGYLSNWYAQDGKVEDMELKGVILEPVEAESRAHDWGEAMLEFLQKYDPQAWEFSKRWAR